jgi:hypothetical protein
MTTYLDAPADLIGLVGQPIGTTEWMEVTAGQLDLFMEATGLRGWIPADPPAPPIGPCPPVLLGGSSRYR